MRGAGEKCRCSIDGIECREINIRLCVSCSIIAIGRYIYSAMVPSLADKLGEVLYFRRSLVVDD